MLREPHLLPPAGPNDRHRAPAATPPTSGSLSAKGPPGHRRANLLDCPIDHLDLPQTIALCEQVIEQRGSAQHMAVNAAKLVSMRSDPRLRESVTQSELITADGQAVVWASRLLADPLPARVTGIDLMYSLLGRAASEGYRVYVLGASPDVLECAIVRIQQLYPAINIAGHRDGYFEPADEQSVVREIAAARPDLLFVAMESPRKDHFLARYRQDMQVPLVMGVGGAIDIVAGVRRRAPIVVQRLGLEWLFRLLQEPRRLMWRYASTNTRFVLLVAREYVRCRVAGRA